MARLTWGGMAVLMDQGQSRQAHEKNRDAGWHRGGIGGVCNDLQRGAGVGEQAHVTGALDGGGDLALLFGGEAGALAAEDFAVGAHAAAEVFRVFPVAEDLTGAGFGED